MSGQLRLNLDRPPDHARAAFVVSTSSALAFETLEAWPDWRGGALALVGPAGSGKTHLASIWAERIGAARWPFVDLAGPPRPLLVEDADGGVGEETLFHLINRASAPGGGLLLTSRLKPGLWPAALPDLRSRLNALPVAELEPPDDGVLDALLRKFFHERNIRPPDDLLAYLLRRIERSADAAASVAARLDEAAHASGRAVSRTLARQVLGEVPEETSV